MPLIIGIRTVFFGKLVKKVLTINVRENSEINKHAKMMNSISRAHSLRIDFFDTSFFAKAVVLPAIDHTLPGTYRFISDNSHKHAVFRYLVFMSLFCSMINQKKLLKIKKETNSTMLIKNSKKSIWWREGRIFAKLPTIIFPMKKRARKESGQPMMNLIVEKIFDFILILARGFHCIKKVSIGKSLFEEKGLVW